MACHFNLTVKGTGNYGGKTQFQLGQASGPDALYSIQSLYSDLSQLSKDDIEALSTAVEAALAGMSEQSEFPSLKSYESRRAMLTFQTHLKKLGIDVIEDTSKSDKAAWVENGVIHINTNIDCKTAPIHELLHLVMGVMKVKDYTQYQKLLQSVEQNEPFQTLFSEICKDDTYKNMMEYDKKEEAFCRMLEELIDEEQNFHNFKLDDVPYDHINQIITPFISETFGIERVPDLLNFLNSTISDLPVYGSTLFLKQSPETTGYLDHQRDIILAGRVSNLVAKWVDEKIITENCL